jgi:hypothetical protein
LAAAPVLGEGVVEPVGVEPPLDLAVGELEGEAEEEELAPLSSMASLPQRASRARSHSNSWSRLFPAAVTHVLYQKRHIWPGTDCS